MRLPNRQTRKIGWILALLLSCTLFLKTTTAQDEGDYAVRFTHVVMMCSEDEAPLEVGWLGAYFQYAGTWRSSGDAILVDHFNGPDLDTGGDFYLISAGSGTYVYNNDVTSWGVFFNDVAQYPYTFQIKVRMIVGGHLEGGVVDQVSGGTVVDQAIATGPCTKPGYTPVTIRYGFGDDGGFQPGDDRLDVDPAAPAAVYCQGKDVQIYAIDSNSEGELALMVTANQLEGDAPSENTLIAQADKISLYRLTTGELQVNVGPDFEGKEYTFIWNSCG